MIVCDLSKVDVVDEGWKIGISKKIISALGLFKGQTVFGSSEEGTRQLFLSTHKLNPSVNYFRVFLEDVRGSLSRVTEIFKEVNINILSGGAFSMGNLWISEFLLDFKDAEATSDDMVNELEGLGGFVTSREITELFPRSFDLQSTFELCGNGSGEMHLVLTSDLTSRIEMEGGIPSYAVMNAWPRVKAIFMSFYEPKTKLLKITAKIKDVPGSLHALADFLSAQVDLQAIDELHHDVVSGEWMAFGVLVMGGLDELREKAERLPTIHSFKAEPFGWDD